MERFEVILLPSDQGSLVSYEDYAALEVQLAAFEKSGDLTEIGHYKEQLEVALKEIVMLESRLAAMVSVLEQVVQTGGPLAEQALELLQK